MFSLFLSHHRILRNRHGRVCVFINHYISQRRCSMIFVFFLFTRRQRIIILFSLAFDEKPLFVLIIFFDDTFVEFQVKLKKAVGKR